MKIYVAGKWQEREKVRNIMDMLESRGHKITCDWTKHIAPERNERINGNGIFTKEYDWSKNIDYIQNGNKTYAQEDLEGVENCDLLIAYMPDPNIFYKGCWVEIGIAIAHRKKVIIIGIDSTFVFLSLPNIIVVQFKEEIFNLIDSMKPDEDYKKDFDSRDAYYFVM